MGVQPRTLRDRAKLLGIEFASDRWTDDELQLLRDYYPLGGVHACLDAGLDRDATSIRNKARRLKIAAPKSAKNGAAHRPPPQDPAIDKVLAAARRYASKQDYPRDRIAAAVGIHPDTVGKHLTQLVRAGLLTPDSKMTWTEAELAILRHHYPIGGASACLAAGLTRTEQAITDQAKRLSLNARRET